MPTTSTDAQLVAGHLAGDRSALAGIYDRYADSLYDTAAAMVRNRHDAADVVQDVVVVAAERLGQLRDPDRLKPWLFAILRNEVYRRSGAKRRTVVTDFTDSTAEMSLPSEPADEASSAEYEELAELVRSAAAGLDERDQLVLEYSVRQGLQGDDLAAALGVSAQQSYGLVHRMRQRTERSLGAYCVARAGRKDCTELAEILAGWTGEFSVLIRKRVARHVDRCDTCERSRRKLAPLALFGAAPALAAPPELRDRVLDRGAHAEPAYGFAAPGGFPSVIKYGRRFRMWFLIGATILLLLAGAGAFVLADRDGGETIATADATGDTTTTTTEPGPTGAASAAPAEGGATATTIGRGTASSSSSSTSTTSSTTIGPTTTTTIVVSAPVTAAAPLTTTTTTPPPPTTTTPPTAPSTTTPPTAPPTVPPGQLTLSADSIDFGTTIDQARVRLTNTGGEPVDWTNATGPAAFRAAATPYSVAPPAGSLEPGESVEVSILVDRTWPIEGPVRATTLSFGGPGTSAAMALAAEIAREPSIDASRTPTLICAFGPSGARNRLRAVAAVADESTPLTVSYEAVNQTGTTRRQSMTLRSGEWFASIAMDDMPEFDLWNWNIVASDAFGNTARTSGTTEVVGTRC